MYRLRIASIPLLVAVVLAFIGCSAEQTVVLDADGAGEARVSITLDPVFEAYLTDVNAGMGASEDAPLFDQVAIEAAFAQRPGVSLRSISIPRRGSLELDLAFESVEHVLALQGHDLTRFLRFERTQSFRRVAAEIDRSAIEHFTGLSGIDPLVVESLLPPEPAMSRREYQDHLAWALEEYTRDRPLERVFSDSLVVTLLQPAGTVVRMEGGVRRDEGVEFTTPLVDAAVSPTPLRYSLVFTP